MSGNGVEIGSELECDMRCEGVDRINPLPDEIIVHILSFLPVLKEVVATSILSSRWLSLWKYNPNLVFVYKRSDGPINIPIVMPPIEGPGDWNIGRSLKTAEWVNSVLNSCKAPSLKQFTISFNLHPKTFYHVSKWLHFAFSKQVENLKLDLEDDSLFCLDINILSGIQSSDYKFLKELTLENLEVTGEAIEFLLHNCSVLERLIMNAILRSDLMIGGGTLKYLEINTSGSLGRFIKVSAPNLTRLSCNYDLERLSLETVPNLVYASFDLLPHEGTMHHVANAAATLESLTITIDRPTAFPVPQMPKLKKVVLDYLIVNEEFLLPVTCILQASPCLEEFKLEISDPQKYSDRGSSICTAILEVPKLGSFQHDHLKVFEFSGFCDKAADHVELVRYIASNCVALDEIIITPTASLARQFLMKFLLRARQYLRRGIGVHYGSFSYKGDDALEQEALDMKKSTEQLLAGKLPDHIKLLINGFVAFDV